MYVCVAWSVASRLVLFIYSKFTHHYYDNSLKIITFFSLIMKSTSVKKKEREPLSCASSSEQDKDSSIVIITQNRVKNRVQFIHTKYKISFSRSILRIFHRVLNTYKFKR